MYITLNAELESLITAPWFDHIMALQGEVYRALENRRTQRIVLNHQAYFLKQHFGVGWKEIIKNVLQWRLPIVSAKSEWQALQRLRQLGVHVPEVVGYGCAGFNPARRQSFLITRALPPHVSLEDFCRTWPQQPPSFRLKQTLIRTVAQIARTLHENGINHRDFYLCHFLLLSPIVTDEIKIYLIDLHRAQMRKHTPLRWIIKDLAGLYFSSKDIGLTSRDLLRFMQEYRNKPLGLVLNKEAIFWQKVKKRGDELYQKHAS